MLIVMRPAFLNVMEYHMINIDFLIDHRVTKETMFIYTYSLVPTFWFSDFQHVLVLLTISMEVLSSFFRHKDKSATTVLITSLNWIPM
jgi:hypothetical protein